MMANSKRYWVWKRSNTTTPKKKDSLLPEGKTCLNCMWLAYCQETVHNLPKDEVCSWNPSRFFEKRNR